MATARFETYVRERVTELAKARRDRLAAALEEEEARVEAQREKYFAMVEEGVEALVSKVVEKAKKDGLTTEPAQEAQEALSEYVKGRVRSMIGLQQKYDYVSHETHWPEGTPARKAQDALLAFDAFCEKEARRIVVYKMDLNMKPDVFEAMLAEVAEKIEEA